MSDLVVDANILFAALIRRGGTAELLLDRRLRLFAPEFLLQEFAKHEKMLVKKTHRSSADFELLMEILSKRIEVIPESEIIVHLERAGTFSPDPDDTAYFAAALASGASLWSNESRLKQQNRIRVYNTTELYSKIFGE